MNTQAELNHATELQKHGEYKQALGIIQGLAIENSKELTLQVRLADAQFKVGNLDAALPLYRRSAMDFAAQGELNKALALHKLILSIHPDESTLLPTISLRYLKHALSRHSDINPTFTELFKDMDFGEITTVLRSGQSYPVAAGDWLCEPGKEVPGLVILLRGSMLVSGQKGDGSLVELDLLTAGDYFGEVYPKDGGKRLAARALTDCDLLYIDPHGLKHSRSRYPSVDQAVSKMVNRRSAQMLLAVQETLGDLPVQVRSDMLVQMEQQNFRRSSVIIRESDKSEYCYLVLSGRVEVYTRNEDNQKLELAMLGPGEIFGEGAALQRAPRTASVKARTDVVLGRITASRIEKLLRDQPQVLDKMRGVFRNRVADTLQRLGGD